jgi:hypothetical protein
LQSTIDNNTQFGCWRITKFIDSGIDEISDFSDYNFIFNSSGRLNARNRSTNFDGICNRTSSNGTDLQHLALNIVYNLMNDFDD